jgi:RNA polymerase sigma-70 factor, ECF subfamily
MTDRNGGNGRDERFRILYQKYFRRVVRFYVRAFHLSEEDAEELAQDAFVRFYEAMDEYRGDAEWAFFETIARHVGLNHIRRHKTQKRNARTVDIDDPQFQANEPAAPPEPDYAERQQAELRQKRLREAMAQLPVGQRECLILFLSDFKYTEIAKSLRISPDAVRSRLRDARVTLRSRLGDHGLPEDEE